MIPAWGRFAPARSQATVTVMSDEADSSPRVGPFWRRLSTRARIAIGIVVVLVLVRVALPTIAQKVIESQGSTYLKGQLVVDDVDLWLLWGAAALEGVALWPDGDVPGENGTQGDPALVAWDRVYVDIAWLPLLDKIANVQDFELDGLAVNVARLHDGTLVLPDLRERPEEEETEEEPDDDSEPFGVLIDRAALLNARVRVRDDIPESPTYRELRLPSIEVRDLAVGDDEATEPGRIVMQAGLRDGTIRVDARVAERDGGFHTETQIDIENLPLDQLHVHEPTLAWTKSAGRLDLSMHIEIDPQARVVLSGNTIVSDLRIDVPNEKEPGLAWKRLAVDINRVDIANQNVDVALVALDGGRVLVRPLQQPPIPILPEALASAPKPSAPDGEAPTEASDDAPDDATTDEAAAPAEPAEQADAPLDWTVRLAALEITDTTAGLLLEQGPASAHIGKLAVTDVDATTTTWSVGAVDLTDSVGRIELPTGSADVEIVSLALTGLTSDPSKPIRVVAKIIEDASAVDVDASVVQEPLAATANLTLENVALGRYADLSGASPVHVPTGTLQAALAIETDGENATVAGQIAIDDLQVLTQDGEDDFSVAWESLLLDIRALEAIVTDPEAPMHLELTEFRLTGPNIRATLTKDGIVLPTVRENEVSGAEPEPEPAVSETAEPGDAALPTSPAEPAEPSEPEPAEPLDGDARAEGEAEPSPEEQAPSHTPVLLDGLAVQTEVVGVDEIREFAEPAANLPVGLVVDRLRIENGTFRLVDRAVDPTYRGKITDFQFELTGFELPSDTEPIDAVFEQMSLDFRAPGDAPVKIRAGTEPKGVQLDANIEKLPLAQFNPYVTQASGYTVLEGAATVESSVLWTKERYKTNTDITLGSLDVGNQSGGSLFKEYFGIPITAALALMRDVTGSIGLGIPVDGSMADGAEVGIGSIVGQAITKAILNAILSPLKMLSVVTLVGGKVSDLAPAPVPFEPGSSKIAKSSRDQVESIGQVLASTPAIKVEFIGRTSAADVRALKEQAVLEEMQSESGFFGGIRNLASGGTRNAIRNALEAGDIGALTDDEKTALDELVSEKEVTEKDLDDLATARAKSLYDAFVDDGVSEEQIAIGTAQTSRDDGAPEVLVNLLQRG